MLKLRVSGTKNDLKTFQRWLEKITDNANAKFELGEQKEPKQNPNNEKYYRYEADLLGPIKKQGGSKHVQNNSRIQSKGRSR